MALNRVDELTDTERVSSRRRKRDFKSILGFPGGHSGGSLSTCFLAALALLAAVFVLVGPPLHAQPGGFEITVLDETGSAVSDFFDGAHLSLEVSLEADVERPFQLYLGFNPNAAPMAQCLVPRGGQRCNTGAFSTLGWYWEKREKARSLRRLFAWKEHSKPTASTLLRIEPRPAVLVHGFISDAKTWANYLGNDGWLAGSGIQGFAVGDGQADGEMNTGHITDPSLPTQTIAENAEALDRYIAGVKRITGASHVDLIAHSMGGLIARYYIARLMRERDVAQLIMLGSPHGGSHCANLAQALGFYLPAAAELRVDYMEHIFNRQITEHNEVPFHFLAGTLITESFKSPCSDVPSDIVVSYGSASAIADSETTVTVPVLHTELTKSETVYQDFVEPLLQKPTSGFLASPPSTIKQADRDRSQFTRVVTGHVNPGDDTELVVTIEDNVAIASFALYDPTRSLTVSVRGASGKVIELNKEKHGFTIIQDPSTLLYLGYGFDHPKPGQWRVEIQATKDTPPKGADFAIMAKLQGGTRLNASTNVLLPRIDENVVLNAHLETQNKPLPVTKAQATIRAGHSKPKDLPVQIQDSKLVGSWKPAVAGVHAIDLTVEAVLPDGETIDRSAFLTVEVQSAPGRNWIFVVFSALVALMILYIFIWLRRKKAH